jgi:hypothetical protein
MEAATAPCRGKRVFGCERSRGCCTTSAGCDPPGRARRGSRHRGEACASRPSGDHRGGFWRSARRPSPGPLPGADHRHRPEEPSHLPAPPLSGGDDGALSRAGGQSDSGYLAPIRQCRRAPGNGHGHRSRSADRAARRGGGRVRLSGRRGRGRPLLFRARGVGGSRSRAEDDRRRPGDPPARAAGLRTRGAGPPHVLRAPRGAGGSGVRRRGRRTHGGGTRGRTRRVVPKSAAQELPGHRPRADDDHAGRGGGARTSHLSGGPLAQGGRTTPRDGRRRPNLVRGHVRGAWRGPSR